MSLCLTVSFTYGGSKAGFTENPIGSVIAILREDLAALRLDQPGVENIRVTAPGRVEFFWPNVMNGGVRVFYSDLLNSRLNQHPVIA